MFSEINAKLVAMHNELRKKAKFNTQLADYQKELETIEETLSELRGQFQLEKRDVEKLERMSLTNLFATIFGTKVEKLSKEKTEMTVAQHKLEEAVKTKKEIDEAINALKHNLQSLKNTENEYQQLLLQKEYMIKTSANPIAEKVFELSDREGALRANLIELDEAYAAGERVELALHDAIKSLEKAESWGTWDMLGGGTLTGVAKHQNIDKAENSLHQAQTSMRQFQKELLDIQDSAFPEVDISGMLRFADFFFDGFIADYMVQGKINKSLNQTKSYYDKINDILTKLTEQSAEKRIELEKVQNEKREIVENL